MQTQNAQKRGGQRVEKNMFMLKFFCLTLKYEFHSDTHTHTHTHTHTLIYIEFYAFYRKSLFFSGLF